MDKNSTLYQLMGLRMNGIMNGITEQDEDYQSLLQEVDKYSDSLEALHLPEETMGRVSFTTKPADTNIAAAVADRMTCPNAVCISTWYQSLLSRYINGMLPTTKMTMIRNSFRGSAIRYSSSAFTLRMSESFATIGVKVVFRLRSFWQSLMASHHSRNTSLSIRPRMVFKAVSTSGLTILICIRKSRNTFDTGGFR